MPAPRLVLVTGATGYIAKHIVAKLLNAGFAVRASARSLDRFSEITQAVTPALDDPAAIDRLSFVALDLSADSGWNAALEGVEILMHTASPFPLVQPKDPEETVRPAVDGALRAVRAAKAAGTKRVIMTSSTVAISGNDLPPGKSADDEDCWTDPDKPGLTPYARSKTLAEQAVWNWTRENAPDMAVTMINPGFVLGRPLDESYGTSIAVIERLVKGQDPMLPKFGFTCVDIEDVADLHIAAIDAPQTHGQRIMGAKRFIWFAEMGRAVKQAVPHRKVPTRTAPNFVVRLLALFDPSIRGILPDLDREQAANPARAEALLGRPLRDPLLAIGETARFIDEKGIA